MNSSSNNSYFTFLLNKCELKEILKLFNSMIQNKINDKIYILIPSYHLYNQIYSSINIFIQINYQFFILEDFILTNFNELNQNFYKEYLLIYFLFLKGVSNSFNLIELKKNYVFKNQIDINLLIENYQKYNTLYTISNYNHINYNSYLKKFTLNSQKNILSKLNNNFDFFNLNSIIYSSQNLIYFFNEHNINYENINTIIPKLLNLQKEPESKLNFYILYNIFLLLNNKILFYNISSSFNLPNNFSDFNDSQFNSLTSSLPLFSIL